MKARLRVELWGYDSPPEGGGAETTSIELEKEINLEFTPFVGLKIQFPGILTNDPQVERARAIRKAARYGIIGIFTVEDVLYNVRKECLQLDVRCSVTPPEDADEDDDYTVEDIRSLADQLTVGYGFEQTWPLDD